MFLSLLMIFPAFAYYIFNKNKDDVKEINGIVKIIGLIGLFILIFGIYVLKNKEAYLVTLTFWYFLVFMCFYILSVNILSLNLDKIDYEKELDMKSGTIKFLYMLFLFIFYVSLYEGKMRYLVRGLDGFKEIFVYFLFQIILFGIIYEIMDVFKNAYLKKIAEIRYRSGLKEVIKQEILDELKFNTFEENLKIEIKKEVLMELRFAVNIKEELKQELKEEILKELKK